MPIIEKYSQAARVAPDSIIRLDTEGRNITVRGLRPSLLGRIARYLRDDKAVIQTRDQATWQNFIHAVKARYQNDSALLPLIQDLEMRSAQKKPLTSMQVETTVENAEHLMRFKNEQVISSVLNSKVEPQANQPPGLANTSSDFLRQAMDEVYHDVAAKISHADPEIYRQQSAGFAKRIVDHVAKLQPEMCKEALSRPQVEQAIKRAARRLIGFRVAVEEQSAATERYKVNTHLPESAKGNQLFLEAAKELGLSIDLKKLPPTIVNELEAEVSKGCRDAFDTLRSTSGRRGQVTDADIEASVKARFSRMFKSNQLPLLEQINQLDIDAASKEKLVDYVCHTPIKPIEGANVLAKVLEKEAQLTAFYKTLPQLLQAVEQSRGQPVENQQAKTALYQQLINHGKMISTQFAEAAAAGGQPGSVDPDSRDSFYAATSDIPMLLSLNDQDKEQLHQACATPAMQEALADLRSARYLVSDAAADISSAEQARTANELVESLHPAFLTMSRSAEASPYNEVGADALSLSDPAQSFSELDNSVIGALRDSGFQLPPIERANQSGTAVMPSSIHADMQANLQDQWKFGSAELDYHESGLAKSFITDFGRAQFTLTDANGQVIKLPRELPIGTEERSKVMLPTFRAFCQQHQRDAWMKSHPGKTPSLNRLQKLTENELKMISQIANANLWFDVDKRMMQGELPFSEAVMAGQSAGTHYHIIAEADGGFRCESSLYKKGGLLMTPPQPGSAEPTSTPLDTEEAYTKASLCVTAKPEDFAAGSKSSSVPQLTGPVSYEYNLKLA